MANVALPTFETLMNPIIQALKMLGGSGTIEEINNKATEIADLSDEQLEVVHDSKKGRQTDKVNGKTVRRYVQNEQKQAREAKISKVTDEPDVEATWLLGI